jgi:hypothetical protein
MRLSSGRLFDFRVRRRRRRWPRHRGGAVSQLRVQIPEPDPATSDGGNPSCMRAIVIEGAGPVGQPSPDTITTAVRLAPRQPLVRAVEAVVSGIHSGLGTARGCPQARHGDRRKRRRSKDRPVSRSS